MTYLSDKSMEVQLPALLVNYDRLIDHRPTDRQTDGHEGLNNLFNVKRKLCCDTK